MRSVGSAAAVESFLDAVYLIKRPRFMDYLPNTTGLILRMNIFNNKTKKAALILVGPLGCYVAYQMLFIVRYLGVEKYPILTSLYMNGAGIIDTACALSVALLGFLVSRNIGLLDKFSPSRESLSSISLLLITIGIFALLVMSFYRVFGTISPSHVIDDYHTYSFMVTKGGAWIVLAMYSALFIQLMNMYFGGVTKKNGAFMIASLIIVSLIGGRGILIVFVLMFVVLLMFQRVSFLKFVIASTLAFASMGASYIIVTDMRAPTTSGDLVSIKDKSKKRLSQQIFCAPLNNGAAISPTESFEDLNYNAAFISEDVLRAIKNNEIEPKAYAIEDAMTLLVPRQIMPSKPISTAETREIYPNVAARGTNITFPLKANVIMHLGGWAFYADWIFVAICQTLMLIGIARRTKAPSIAGFAMMFCGLGFMLIARGGIFNARLLVIALCIFAAYAGYCALLRIQRYWDFIGRIPGESTK